MYYPLGGVASVSGTARKFCSDHSNEFQLQENENTFELRCVEPIMKEIERITGLFIPVRLII